MMMRGKIKERENESAVREDSTFFYLYPLGFANCQPIYYFSHIRKSLGWTTPNHQEKTIHFIWILGDEIV